MDIPGKTVKALATVKNYYWTCV